MFSPWCPLTRLDSSEGLKASQPYLTGLKLLHGPLNPTRVKDYLVELLRHLLIESHEQRLLGHLLLEAIVAPSTSSCVTLLPLP